MHSTSALRLAIRACASAMTIGIVLLAIHMGACFYLLIRLAIFWCLMRRRASKPRAERGREDAWPLRAFDRAFFCVFYGIGGWLPHLDKPVESWAIVMLQGTLWAQWMSITELLMNPYVHSGLWPMEDVAVRLLSIIPM